MDNTLMMSGINYKLMDEMKSDNIIINIVFAIFIGAFINKIMNLDFFSYIYDIPEYFEYFQKKQNKIEFITQRSQKKNIENSINYKAVMHYISSNKNKTIYKLTEHFSKAYNYDSDQWDQDNYFKVNQTKFKITDKITGEILVKSENEKAGDKEIKVNSEHFIISSKILSLIDLQKWISQKKTEYDNYMKDKLDTSKNILICSWNNKDKFFQIERREWNTTSSFENKFFEGKEEIVKRIEDFENGEEFYKKKGLEYQFGIMLSGEPGCGKTTFIKCLAQKTERLIILVKWTCDSNLEGLARLILGDRIGEYSIPHKKRLWVFEDIDAMGDIVRDRDLVEKERKDKDTVMLKMMKCGSSSPVNIVTKDDKPTVNTKSESTMSHNNLSTYLNAIQGIEESHGRMTVSTTNKPETIDPAVMRPGRVDDHIIMKKANNKIILQILNYYYETNCNINTIPDNLSYKYTLAEISGKCKTSSSFDGCLEKLKSSLKT